MICSSCGAPVDSDRIIALSQFVASDCQPRHSTLSVMTCIACGLVQKPNTQEWARVCEQIYSNYRIYYQGAGREQKARGVMQGRFAPRSELLAEFMIEADLLGKAGSALDVGCGNGAFLRAFHTVFPEWQLAGAEINETFSGEIKSIAPGAEFFVPDELEKKGSSFELVTLIHCLEHIPSPVAYLDTVKRHLSRDSLLLIQVPDAEINPFDLVIADHASHFSKASLRRVIEEAGLETLDFGNLVLAKEITALVRLSQSAAKRTSQSAYPDFAGRHLAWIGALLAQAKALAQQGPLGIFGSSIAGTWLGSQLERLAFFVDEDADRIGQTNLGVPILGVADVPKEINVLLALEPTLARSLAPRLNDAGVSVVLPPANEICC
jgi:SAM-dependent methyltransferase